jgi:hypothetical protein
MHVSCAPSLLIPTNLLTIFHDHGDVEAGAAPYPSLPAPSAHPATHSPHGRRAWELRLAKRQPVSFVDRGTSFVDRHQSLPHGRHRLATAPMETGGLNVAVIMKDCQQVRGKARFDRNQMAFRLG